MPDPVTLTSLAIGAATGVGTALGSLLQKWYDARRARADARAEAERAKARAAAAAHAEAAVAHETGRHAVAVAEVGVVPALLKRIEALEAARDDMDARCDEELEKRDRRIDALEHSLVERDATIATLTEQVTDMRTALNALGRAN